MTQVSRIQSHFEPKRYLRQHVAEIIAASEALLDQHGLAPWRTLGGEVLTIDLARLHDLGKGSAFFQEYIANPGAWKGDPGRKSHTLLSLVLATAWAESTALDPAGVIARALAVKPEFLVCDEAVAALDVSIQAQVLNLFIKLRDELNLTYLFISHDLGVVRHLSDRVVIMYLGRVVESAPSGEIFNRPNHPYTQALLASAPRLEVKKIEFVAVRGEIPSPLNPPTGCHFHPRCPHAMPRCSTEKPALREIAAGGHYSACHLNG